MDPLAWVLSIGFGFVSLSYIATVMARTVVRLRELQVSNGHVQFEARLQRMEAALDAIAIEVERAGELQRFTARLHDPGVSERTSSIARPITPH